jgi:formyltetrahydrofolate synthetase
VLRPVKKIAAELGIDPAVILPHGHRIAKVPVTELEKRAGDEDGVDYDYAAESSIDLIEKHGEGQVPVCTAKTQMSLTGNAKLRGRLQGFRIRVNEVTLSAGAGFVLVICGKIMTLPGLPKVPAAKNIKVDDQGRVTGLS